MFFAICCPVCKERLTRPEGTDRIPAHGAGACAVLDTNKPARSLMARVPLGRLIRCGLTDEIIIEPGPLQATATPAEADAAMCDLFTGLSAAITRYGCAVDIDDPSRIVVRRRST
jgi:hypothetical protein